MNRLAVNTRTRVKICGLTSVEDAMRAVNAGADAIGLVFYPPSPRNVVLEQATEIAASLPAFVTKTALFVNPTEADVQAVLQQVSVNLLQFHGDESPAFCEQFQCDYIKAIRMKDGIDLERIAQQYTRASGLLLDAYKAGIPGGTGEQFDWARVPRSLSKPIILAGGLTPENVQQAIEQTQPWAVDVSGGVERSKGIKSAEKMEQFMQRVMSRVE
ncbi:Phosphoribosylanthranilate isomerase [hydrothermal vent metagenome]|uniref:phosphoribosylanthranilate isomerase n=1 Tax=hydrothermal vent metagenome TaxID=652676 RepID=A0A3B0WA17_9ZZZZ